MWLSSVSRENDSVENTKADKKPLDSFIWHCTLCVQWTKLSSHVPLQLNQVKYTNYLLSVECDCICLGYIWYIILEKSFYSCHRIVVCVYFAAIYRDGLEYGIYMLGCWLLYRLIECMQYVVIMEWQTRVSFFVAHSNLNNNDLETSHFLSLHGDFIRVFFLSQFFF